jgi:hypothetical protein
MSRLKKVTTEVFFIAQGVTRKSLIVSTLTTNPEIIKQEAVHKARACYGLDITNVILGNQSIS